jgi:hypothetical protein
MSQLAWAAAQLQHDPRSKYGPPQPLAVSGQRAALLVSGNC